MDFSDHLMRSNNLTAPFQNPATLFELITIPLLGLIVFLLIDAFCIQGAFTLPFLLLLVLGYLAVRLPLWAVLVWAMTYSAVILTLLLLHTRETITIPAFQPYLRAATFLAGGIVAAVLAGHRTRLEMSFNSLFKVLWDMPQPVIVSDISGTILLINKEAGKLLDNPDNNLSGLSFFSTFSSPDDQGRSIANYLSYFSAENHGPHKLILHTRGRNDLALIASLSVVGIPSQPLAVTVIEGIKKPELAV